MAASQGQPATTVSRWTAETAQGSHVFEVDGYSTLDTLGAGEYIRSATFEVGGHSWSIRFYPNGHTNLREEWMKGYVATYIELMKANTQVTAIYELKLINQVSPGMNLSKPKVKRVFKGVNRAYGYPTFIKRTELEAASPYLKDDRLMVQCILVVIMATPLQKSEMICDIQVPPSDLSEDLGKLLGSKEGADVAFSVEGEVFHAHRIVLAMRSRVFKAELYGPMCNKSTQSITVEDMHPAVFKALLHFIYTDSLPPTDDPEGAESKEIVKHLLVAADRYAMERMKVLCERILSKTIDVESVATILALADQHHCSKLKHACIQFIMSSNRMGDVMSSQGYDHLKRACPTVFVDIWEKSAKARKI